MKHLLFILPVFFLACSVEPESLNYGTDACHFCKMTLMDKKFGAEIVTAKGKVYKFDDVNCMMNFMDREEINERELAHRLVVDFSKPGQLVEAVGAFYLKSPTFKTPMASQVAAFEQKDTFDSVNKELRGIYITWGELIAHFK